MSCFSVVKKRFDNIFERAGVGHILVCDSDTQGVLALYRDSDSVHATECKAEALIGDLLPAEPVPAIYFLHPTESNIRLVDEDIRRRPFSKFYVVFTKTLSPTDRQRLTDCARTFRRDVTIEDSFLAFSLVDSRVAVTNHKDAIVALSSNTRDEWLDCIIPAVASVLLALDEQPSIRYAVSGARTGSGKQQHAEMQDVTYQAARKLQEHLRSASKQPLVHRPEGTADTLILHRGFDLIASLVHDPTLEAVLHDLHPPSGPPCVDKDGNVLEMPEPVGAAQEVVWEEIRHLPAKEAAEHLYAIDQELLAAQQRVREEQTAKAVRQVLDQTPRLEAAQALHRQLRARWSRIQALLALGRAERRAVASGGRDWEDAAASVLEKYEFPNRTDVVRLLVVCRWALGRPLPAARLQQWAAQEVPIAEKVVQNLESRLQWTRTWRQALTPQAIPKSPRGPPPAAAAPPPLPPLLADILQAAAANALPPTLLPPLPADPSETRRANLRVGFDWTRRTLTDGPDPSVNTRRLVVVVLGGLAHAEVRLAYQLSRQLHRNILLISTSLQHPNELINYAYHHAPAPPTTPPGSPLPWRRTPTPPLDPYRPVTPPASPPLPATTHQHHPQYPQQTAPYPHNPPQQQEQQQQPGHRLFPSRNRAGAPGHQRYLSNPDALQMNYSPDPYSQPPSSTLPRQAATPPPSRPTHQRRLSDPHSPYQQQHPPPQPFATPPPTRPSPDPTSAPHRPRSPMPLPYTRPRSPNPPPSPPATRHPAPHHNPFLPPSNPAPRPQPPRSFSPLIHHQRTASSPPLNDTSRSRTPPPAAPPSRLHRMGARHARHTSEILNHPPAPTSHPTNPLTNASSLSSTSSLNQQPAPQQRYSAGTSGYSAGTSGYSAHNAMQPPAAALPALPRWYTPDGPTGAQPLPPQQYQAQYQPYGSGGSGGGSSSTSSSKPSGWLKKVVKKF